MPRRYEGVSVVRVDWSTFLSQEEELGERVDDK